jgi:hypothetical protein
MRFMTLASEIRDLCRWQERRLHFGSLAAFHVFLFLMTDPRDGSLSSAQYVRAWRCPLIAMTT